MPNRKRARSAKNPGKHAGKETKRAPPPSRRTRIVRGDHAESKEKTPTRQKKGRGNAWKEEVVIKGVGPSSPQQLGRTVGPLRILERGWPKGGKKKGRNIPSGPHRSSTSSRRNEKAKRGPEVTKEKARRKKKTEGDERRVERRDRASRRRGGRSTLGTPTKNRTTKGDAVRTGAQMGRVVPSPDSRIMWKKEKSAEKKGTEGKGLQVSGT